MTKYFLFIASFFISLITLGQGDSSEVKMLSEHGSKNNEIQNLLLFQDIDYYKIKFTGKNLGANYFTVLAKEVWDGKIKKIDTLIDSKKNKKIGAIGSDTLTLTLLGSMVDNNKLKLFFRFPMVGMMRKYDATNSDDYSLRNIGSNLKIQKNKFFPAFAYILPHINGNWKEYCTVDRSGINVEDWGKEFKLKHYIIFYIKFED